jgi:hypothetical protein
MPSVDDPEFLNAMQKVFATRGDIKMLIDYQQKLFNSFSELNASHRAVHEHVRTLTESHNRGQDNTGVLMEARRNLETLLRNLENSHNQTREEMRRALDVLNRAQQELRKIPQLEDRIERLEREIERFKQEERQNDRKDDDQDQRLRKLETKR